MVKPGRAWAVASGAGAVKSPGENPGTTPQIATCLVKVAGFTIETKKNIIYFDLESARLPVPCSAELPQPEMRSHESNPETTASSNHSSHSDIEGTLGIIPGLHNQFEMNDLVRDFGLSKAGAELLASRRIERKLTQNGVKIAYYKSRESEFLKFFSTDCDFVYCNDISATLSSWFTQL